MNAAALLLAAGASSRLNTPKQLVRFRGEALLRHAARIALRSRCTDVIVVTGAFGERCAAEIADLPVTVRHNPRWADGLSHSIRAGMAVIAERILLPDFVVLLVCDQPHLETALIDQLVETHVATGRGIVASHYAGTLGVPALFAADYYPALATLEGDCGARQLFQRFSDDCASVPFPRGDVDIDTPADLQFVSHQTESVSGMVKCGLASNAADTAWEFPTTADQR